MDSETENNLWKELELLQPVIDKFDDFTFRIKNWFLTIFIAVSGFSIVENNPTLLWLNVALVFIFYFYEVTYRTAHIAFLQRSRDIQRSLRNQDEISEADKGPYLDKYLFESGKINEDSRLLSLMLKVGLEEIHAKKTASQTITMSKELWKMLFQFRVSSIYLFALIVTLVISYISTP